jgi:hypothetical protein
MKEKIPHLTFTCTKKFSDMAPDKNGRFCAACKTTVKDFRSLTAEEIRTGSLSENNQAHCGNFYAYQLHRPFGNWKDRVIRLYQYFTHHQNRPGVLRPVALFFVSSLLIITGCRSRQLAGAYAYGFDCSRGNAKLKKEVHKEKQNVLGQENTKAESRLGIKE